MKDNADEMLPLVDEQGNVIGQATRGVCHNGVERPLHPVVHLHVFDPQGRLYLQKRPEWKDIQPGKWDTAVGGHIDLGESVDEALRREVREELGITDFTPQWLGRYVFECERERELVNVFRATVATPPRPTEELDGGAFWTRGEIMRAIASDPSPLTPNFAAEYLRLFGGDEGERMG